MVLQVENVEAGVYCSSSMRPVKAMIIEFP